MNNRETPLEKRPFGKTFRNWLNAAKIDIDRFEKKINRCCRDRNGSYWLKEYLKEYRDGVRIPEMTFIIDIGFCWYIDSEPLLHGWIELMIKSLSVDIHYDYAQRGIHFTEEDQEAWERDSIYMYIRLLERYKRRYGTR